MADDDAFGAVDDKSAVLGHQGDVAKIDLLLLDVADGFGTGVGVFLVDGQADGDPQRRGVSHAAFLAFDYVVLQLQAYRVAALIADDNGVFVGSAAAGAVQVAGALGVGAQAGAAGPAGRAQMVQPFQVAALALPVPDGVVHEVKLREPAEIQDGEDGGKNALQPEVFSLGRQPIHLQKAVVAAPLDFDQIRDLDGGLDFGEIEPRASPPIASVLAIAHSLPLAQRHFTRSRSQPGAAQV